MFTINKHDGTLQPWEYFPAAAGTYKCGQALQLTNGQLSPISAAIKITPPYICMGDVTVEAGHAIPVIRVTNTVIFETSLSAETANAVTGSMLEVSAGGLQVDGTEAGTFEVTDVESAAAGGTVYGRFK